MEQYNVTGMSCAACSARVEKAVSKVPGVSGCSLSLLTNSMGVEGTAAPKDIIAAVEAAGYGASLKRRESAAKAASSEEDALKDRETPLLKKRLIASLCLLIPLMYLTMGHMMWGWPLPHWFDDNHVAMGLVQLILTGLIMVINQRFFISGFKSLMHRAPNMDTLVSLGATASFAWSVFVLFAMTRATVDGDGEAVMRYMMDFYFESAAMILTLITVGKMLEAHAKGKTTDALKGLMKLAPKTAVVIRDGVETEVPIEQVMKGDVFAVRPGESIPVDGIVLEGMSAVNEAALTGESIPVDKSAGDPVSAATINQSGYLKCEATRVGEDTTLSQIIKMVSDAAATKAPIAKIADRVSGVFVPVVIGIAIVTTVIWLLCGREIGYALARGISVLVISCPCALGLATPVAIMVGNGVGARNGILFKTAVSLEEAGKTDIVVLDKTGTITVGEPRVTDIIPAAGISESELISLAAAVEQHSEHPLAKAVMAEAEQRQIRVGTISGFQALSGNGVSGRLGDSELTGGSLKYISAHYTLPAGLSEQAKRLSDQGKTPLLFARDGVGLGIIAVADVIKEDSPQAIRELRDMGIRVVMLTGDNRRTAQAIGAQAGVDAVVAGVLPDGKERKSGMSRYLSFPQRAEQSLLKEYRKRIWRPFMKAIRQYELIQPNDRIAVCISGGKDSMLMAKLMQILQRHSEVPFEATYLIMDPGYNEINRHKVESNAKLLGIPYTLFESDIFEIANSQERNPCFLCAKMRRGCLYNKARELGCNKIALGHHFNDVIETTVIGMLYGGQLQGMMPKLHSRNFPGMELIRPLYMVHEEDIIAWKNTHELSFIQCACRFTENCTMCDNGGGGSKRQEIKQLLKRLNRENCKVEQNIFNSIHMLQMDTMPGWKKDGVEHTFLEWY